MDAKDTVIDIEKLIRTKSQKLTKYPIIYNNRGLQGTTTRLAHLPYRIDPLYETVKELDLDLQNECPGSIFIVQILTTFVFLLLLAGLIFANLKPVYYLLFNLTYVLVQLILLTHQQQVAKKNEDRFVQKLCKLSTPRVSFGLEWDTLWTRAFAVNRPIGYLVIKKR